MEGVLPGSVHRENSEKIFPMGYLSPNSNTNGHYEPAHMDKLI